MSPEPDLGELLANDASRICFRWPEMAVFRVSVKVAEISYPSTFSVVEFLGITILHNGLPSFYEGETEFVKVASE